MNYFYVTHELLDVDPLVISEYDEPLPQGLAEDWVWSVVGPPHVWVDGTDHEAMHEAVEEAIERIESRHMCLEELDLGLVSCLYGAEDVWDLVYRVTSDIGLEYTHEIVQDGDEDESLSCVVRDVRDRSRACRVSRDEALGYLSVSTKGKIYVSSWRDVLHYEREEDFVRGSLTRILDQDSRYRVR